MTEIPETLETAETAETAETKPTTLALRNMALARNTMNEMVAQEARIIERPAPNTIHSQPNLSTPANYPPSTTKPSS